MDELLEQFLIEGRELVQVASDDLLALERDPTDSSRLDSLFRAIHTLKGSVGLFDLAPMGAMLHVAEDLLGAVREGRLAADRDAIDALLDCVGASEDWLDTVARVETLPPGAAAQSARLAAALRAVLGDDSHGAQDIPATDGAWLEVLLARDPAAVAKARAAGRQLVALRYVPDRDCFFRGDDPMALVRSVPGLILLHVSARESWPLDDFDPFACNLVIELVSAAPASDLDRIFRPASDQVRIAEVPAAGAAPAAAGDRTLRVDAARIDALVDIVGELLVAKNALALLAGRVAEVDPGLGRALLARQAEIERLVAAMHRAAMATRMVPLGRAFRPLPRLVREIAARLGKEVRFEIAGGDIEADKTVADGLHEPLLHLLRNAVDHGVEQPTARRAAGKAPIGSIILRASHEADQLIVSVTDDGAGIDAAKVRATARARGLMDEATLDAMTDEAVAALIFTPGFSTADRVTDVSGRGVGMDSVRAAVERLGGRIATASKAGAGSTISLILPQSVRLTSIVIVSVAGEQFGVPIGIVEETARIPADRIVPIRDGAAFAWRDRTVPMVRLAELLHLPAAPTASGEAKVLIVRTGDQRLGLMVDGLGERVDVMLRPLQGLLAGMPGVTGAALMGDGSVLFVLDLTALIG